MNKLLVLFAVASGSLLPASTAHAQIEEVLELSGRIAPTTPGQVLIASGGKRQRLLGEAENEVNVGEFANNLPSQLQFSCAVMPDREESDWARLLTDGRAEEKLAAARVLWKGHSRRHAEAVINAARQSDRPAAVELSTDIELNLRLAAIKQELTAGNYRWGAWLAYLRPHADLVPTLIDALQSQADERDATMLALGASRDRRALPPLVAILTEGDNILAGDAAEALGLLGLPEAEPHLIKAVRNDSGWICVNAARALGKVGTAVAIPVLQPLADSDRYTGALAIKRVAQQAIDAIKARESRQKS